MAIQYRGLQIAAEKCDAAIYQKVFYGDYLMHICPDIAETYNNVTKNEL